MSGKKKVTLGVIAIVAGIVLFLTVTILTNKRPELRILSPISAGIVGACTVLGSELIQRGRNPKLDKQKRIEQQDERNLLIRGKAAVYAFYINEVLILLASSYFMHILEDDTAGLVCCGVAVAGFVIYAIACRIIGRTV